MIRHAAFIVSLAIFVPSCALAGEPAVYRIGVSKSMFRSAPPALAKLAGQPFQDLMKDRMGLTGEIVPVDDPLEMARMIDEGELQLAVFPGHEFAWAQEKYSELVPLVCSVDRPKQVQAVILVKHDCKATSLADMKGSQVVLSPRLKDHARLFWTKQQADAGKDSTFQTTEKIETVHDGIRKVMDSEADLTVADFADWSYFQKLYPGPSKNLRVLARSEEFPATVLVAKKGGLPEPISAKIRNGFLNAHKNAKSARVMKMIRIDRFSELPENYEESLRLCRKSYPKPLGERE